MTIIPFPEQEGCGCCASPEAKTVTLPVAPRASARCRFCGEEKLAKPVMPVPAVTWLGEMLSKGKKVSGVELDGPGDPLAQLAPTLDTLTLLKETLPELDVTVTTLGFGLAEQARTFAEHGVGHITLRMDALDPEVVQSLHVWIRPGTKNIPLAKASAMLVAEQDRAVDACRLADLNVSLRTTVYAGINEQEVEKVARYGAGKGITTMTLVPAKPCSETPGIDIVPSSETMQQLRDRAALHLKNVEIPSAGAPCEIRVLPTGESAPLPKPTPERPNVAVVSSNGMEVDLHLGQAIQILIYGPREGDNLPCLLEARPAPEPGGGGERWHGLANTLPDCFALLAASAGENPRKILGQNDITVVICEEEIEGVVDKLYGGGKKSGVTGSHGEGKRRT